MSQAATNATQQFWLFVRIHLHHLLILHRMVVRKDTIWDLLIFKKVQVTDIIVILLGKKTPALLSCIRHYHEQVGNLPTHAQI